MLYGFQYFRPPFPNKEFWERDIKQIHEMSFNCVKFWAVWNAIEKEKGIFDFTDLDSLIELAEKYKLKVIINLIPE